MLGFPVLISNAIHSHTLIKAIHMEPELTPRARRHPHKPGLRQTWLNRPVMLAIPAGLLFVLTSLNTSPAHAAEAAALQAASTAAHTYDIPAQPLGQALAVFGKQTGIQITYDPALLAGKTSAQVAGSMPAQEALQKLLSQSGLSYRYASHDTIVIQNAATSIMLGPVRVAGSELPSSAMIGALPPTLPGGQNARGGQVGIFGNRDVMDTPFNTTSYTEDFIEKRQIRTIRDALKDDPSVRAGFATGTAGVERIQIRGFNIDNQDMALGGIYGMLPFNGITSELAERVEVLRGPAALLNGMTPGGSVGGVVNIIPKRAHDKPITKIEADYTSNTQFGGHADLGRRFGKDKQLGVRLNGMIRSGSSPIDYNDMKTALIASGIDLRLHRVRFSTDFGYQVRDINGVLPYYQLSSNMAVPDAGRVKRNFNLPWSYLNAQDFFGVFRTEVDLFRNFTAYGTVGVHDYQVKGAYYQQMVIKDAQGNATASTPVGIAQHGRYLTAEVGVRGKIDSGPITQELAFSANRLDYMLGRQFANNNAVLPDKINIYSGLGTYYSGNNISVPGSAPIASTVTLESLAFADTISALDKRIQVTGGLRVQRVQSSNYGSDHVGVKTSSYDQTAISPAVLAVFKPLKNVSIYGNWIQGLQQGGTVASNYANAGQVFSPYKSTQYEVGVKADLKKFILSLDVFQITQPSLTYDVKTNIQSENGEQRNRGLEINIAGEIIHGLRATGGVMLVDARMKKTQGGTYDGQTAPNTAPVNFNMGLDYDIPFIQNLAVTADVMYTAFEYIENSNTNRRRIPGWVRLDMGARYSMKNPASQDGKLTFMLNVDNVTNERYWNSGGYNYLSLSAPRTVRFGVTADF